MLPLALLTLFTTLLQHPLVRLRQYKVSGRSSVGGPVTAGIRGLVREKPPINKFTPNP
jgi:hypothetical protein